MTFQQSVKVWVQKCFGNEIACDKQERSHRFLEEALELVQACGGTEHEAQQLVKYVYGRPLGVMSQEVGGVMVTLAALCTAHELKMFKLGHAELKRNWEKIDEIRKKQAGKSKHGPLPQ